jgi:hypothetical protein
MDGIDDATWCRDSGSGTLGAACAAFFSTGDDDRGHLDAWRWLLDVAGVPRAGPTGLRYRLAALRHEHVRRGGRVHPGNTLGL